MCITPSILCPLSYTWAICPGFTAAAAVHIAKAYRRQEDNELIDCTQCQSPQCSMWRGKKLHSQQTAAPNIQNFGISLAEATTTQVKRILSATKQLVCCLQETEASSHQDWATIPITQEMVHLLWKFLKSNTYLKQSWKEHIDWALW